MITGTASGAGICSQIRITRQPAASSAADTFWSRATLRANLADQYSGLALGVSAWAGHRCHQQPSTNTHNLWRENTISTRTLSAPMSSRRWTRYLRPCLWSSDRNFNSGDVLRLLFARIAAVTIVLLGGGVTRVTAATYFAMDHHS